MYDFFDNSFYGLDYGYTYRSSFGSVPGTVILLAIALGAAIALCIFCYVKYMGKNAETDTVWGARMSKFFNMDHLYINKIIKVFYMIGAVFTAVFNIFLPFIVWALTGRFLLFLASIFVAVFLLVLNELLLRLTYEFTYMFVRMAVDVREIRNATDAIEAKVEQE